MTGPAPSRALWWLAALTLVVRGLYVWQMRSDPFARAPLVDADTYDQWAQAIAHGDWLGHETFWQAPLYPYLLALIYRVAGHSYAAVRIVQIVLSAGTTCLVYLTGRRTVGERAARAGAAAFAVYGTAVYFDNQLLSPSLVLFLEMAFVRLTLRALDAPTRGRWAAAGGVLGLAILARPETAILGVAAGVWALVRPGTDRPRRRGLLLAAAIACAVTSVALVRNYAVEREWVPVSYNGGVNFYIGNNADYARTVGVRPFFEWKRLAREPLAHGAERPGQQSRWFVQQSMRWIEAHPGAWAALLARKTWATLQGVERMRNGDLYAARASSPVLAALLWVAGVACPFGLLLPVAVLGIVAGRRDRRDGALLVWTALAAFLTCIVFFPTARYRLPAVPVLALFAGQGALWCADAVRARSARRLAMGGASVLAMAVLFAVGQGPASPPAVRAETALSLGSVLDREGRHDDAIASFRRALLLHPAYPEADFGIAVAYLGAGRADSAAIYAARAAHAAPDIEDPWHTLAIAEQVLGHPEESAAAARRALAANPLAVESRIVLAVALAQAGSLPDAAVQADSAALAPDPPAAGVRALVRVFAATGDLAAAQSLVDRVIARHPEPELLVLREQLAAARQANPR